MKEEFFFSQVKEFVKQTFLTNGKFQCGCFMMVEENVQVPSFMFALGKFVFMPTPLYDKDLIRSLIKLTAIHLKASALVFATEAWMVAAKPEDAAKAMKIATSENPARQECLIITDETKTTIKSTVIPILRDEGLSLGNEEVTTELSGRFVGFLYEK